MIVKISFVGNKDAVGQVVNGYIIGLLKHGTAIDNTGLKFGTYKRIRTDDGPYGDGQEIEFLIGENKDNEFTTA